MTLSATIETRRLRDFEGIAFHALLIGFVIATQIIYVHAHNLGPDNTWHYRLAREVVSGGPLYWAGLDGNRLFPDLAFSIIAYLLSGGALFAGWLPYFYCVFFIALYLSLTALAATLYDGLLERRAFLLLSVAGLWVFEISTPFWGRWFFDPGNHGTGLPVALACLALAFRMNAARCFGLLPALAFVLAAALLLGSNRFLLIGFLAPLLLALMVVLAARWTMQRRVAFGRCERVLAGLIAMVCVAAIGGVMAYKALNTLGWHKSVTYMEPAFANALSFGWAVHKFGKEIVNFETVFSRQTWHVAIGPALILLTVPAGAALLLQTSQRGRLSGVSANRVVFGMTAAFSALLSLAFVIWAWDEGSEWRYRYLAMSTAFAVVFLCSLLPRGGASFGRPGWLAAGTTLGLVALTEVLAAHGERPALIAQNEEFLRDVDRLEQLVAQRTNEPRPRGLSEY